jgi:hypothetical protein
VSPLSSGIRQSPGAPRTSASVATNATRPARPLSAPHERGQGVRGREHEADVGVVEHPDRPLHAPGVVRQRRGHRDHAGVQAAEEHRQEVDRVGVQEQDGAVALRSRGEPCGDRARVTVEVLVGHDLLDQLAPDPAQVGAGPAARVPRGLCTEVRDEVGVL